MNELDMRYISKKDMTRIMETIKSLLREEHGDNNENEFEPLATTYLESSISYNGWLVKFNASLTETREAYIYEMESISFEPELRSLCNEIFNS